MITRADITGLVLAGGLGRRMSADGNGINKALQVFKGRPMIAHVIERLAPQVDQLIVNANRDLPRIEALGHPVITDRTDDFAGPLAGLQAGLHAAITEWVLTAPCDSPFLPMDLAARLGAAADAGGADIAVVKTGGRAQPVFALVRRRLCGSLEQFLESGGRKIDAWYAPLAMVEVEFEDEAGFRNINTPADLRRWEAEA